MSTGTEGLGGSRNGFALKTRASHEEKDMGGVTFNASESENEGGKFEDGGVSGRECACVCYDFFIIYRVHRLRLSAVRQGCSALEKALGQFGSEIRHFRPHNETDFLPKIELFILLL